MPEITDEELSTIGTQLKRLRVLVPAQTLLLEQYRAMAPLAESACEGLITPAATMLRQRLLEIRSLEEAFLRGVNDSIGAGMSPGTITPH